MKLAKKLSWQLGQMDGPGADIFSKLTCNPSTSEQLASQLGKGFSEEELARFKEYIQRAKANLERPPAETIRTEFLPVDF